MVGVGTFACRRCGNRAPKENCALSKYDLRSRICDHCALLEGLWIWRFEDYLPLPGTRVNLKNIPGAFDSWSLGGGEP